MLPKDAEPPSRHPARWRFALLMFLQYSPPGAMLPLFSLWLQELGFTPFQIGQICATQAMATLVGPLLFGQIADRWFPAERCLACCAYVSGILLWVLSGLNQPVAVFWGALGFWMMMAPAFTLGTSLCFHHLAEPARDYGRVRMFGTVGWVLTSWFFGFLLYQREWIRDAAISWLGLDVGVITLADTFRLGAITAFIYGTYALTLPHTPPRKIVGSPLAPLAALRLMREPSFAVLCVMFFGFSITYVFTTQVNPLLLDEVGIPRPWLPHTLSIGQFTEVTSLALLPVLLHRLGPRNTMRFGLAALVVTLLVLMKGTPTWLVMLSFLGNGLYISCFIVAGQIFVNGRARGDIRASAQGLITALTGIGMLLGNLLVGWVRQAFDGAFAPTYATAAGIALSLIVVFVAGFKGDEETAAEVDTASGDVVRAGQEIANCKLKNEN
jgi:predicted MFS family arabinose efflux permease